MSGAGDDCCAACGKGGAALKKCNACKEVFYCSKECQQLDWRGHRAECKQRQAELLEEALFNTPCSIGEDCPICFLPLGEDQEKYSYQMCCGKRLCLACLFSIGEDQTAIPIQQRHLPACPFCRAPGSFRHKEVMRRLQKRIAVNDVQAFPFLAGMYQHGILGVLAKDTKKAMELYVRGVDLGSAECHAHLGGAYHTGWAAAHE